MTLGKALAVCFLIWQKVTFLPVFSYVCSRSFVIIAIQRHVVKEIDKNCNMSSNCYNYKIIMTKLKNTWSKMKILLAFEVKGTKGQKYTSCEGYIVRP